jgi:hypothetical protein
MGLSRLLIQITKVDITIICEGKARALQTDHREFVNAVACDWIKKKKEIKPNVSLKKIVHLKSKKMLLTLFCPFLKYWAFLESGGRNLHGI